MYPKYFLIIVFCIFFIIINAQENKEKMNPQSRSGIIERANHLRKLENYSGAIQVLDSILNIDPKDASILLYKGDLNLQRKNFKEAVKVYKEILPLKYETTIVRINLSYALFMNHSPAIALQYAKKA